MKHTLLLLAVGVAIGALIANKKEPEKTVETMKKATAVSAKADKVVSSKISEMKQTIEVLEDEKQQLVEQVKVMENEIVAVKSVAPAQPFNVLAIVSDSTSRK
jgi:hypothetical protein